MVNDKVSVLIGTYNRAHLLERCLRSVIDQKYKNKEIIIIDDASVDNTQTILKKYKQLYPQNLFYFRNEINKGIAFNSNLAFSYSTGKYLALIGDDDEWTDKDKLKKQVDVFKQNAKIGLVGTFWKDISGSKIERIHSPVVAVNAKAQILVGNGVYCGSTAMISREAWHAVDGFDLNMSKGTDSELFRSIIVKGKYLTYIVPEISTNVYVGGSDRMTITQTCDKMKMVIRLNRYIIKKHIFSFILNPIALIKRQKKIIKIFIKVYILKKCENI